jgi:hypothetical protein
MNNFIHVTRPFHLFLIVLCFFYSFFIFAQTEKSRELIRKDYDFSKLGSMHVDLEFDYEKNRKKALQLAKSNNWKVKEILPNGKKVELQEVGDDGSPLYYETYSDNASQVSRATALHENGALELNLSGSGMQVGVWDAGVVLTTHQEYDVRATVGDGSTEVDKHATMVAGSIVSAGIKKEAKGVAFEANVISNNWTRDKIEVVEAASNGLLLSNHSYGIKTDRVPDWYFGSYIKVSQDWDKIMFNAPYYLMVTAAGNSQKRGDNQSPIYGTSSDGFDLMLGFTITKNGLTVAAANTKLDRKGNLKEANVSAYSSFGPVDDGRIKPDLAGDGSSIISTSSTGNANYDSSSGTSMATPGVTGALLLLQQYNEQLYGSYLKAATLKGLALHTADDVDSPGPDYKMGWGIMNAKTAAEMLLNKDFSTQITENTLEEGESYSFTVQAIENETLMVSLSWTDPESEFVNRGELNLNKPALVNDLDIRITQNGKTYLPWKLNPTNSKAPATQGDNLVDPYEQIEIPYASGTYTVTVSHKGFLTNEKQDYSLLVSGVEMTRCNINTPDNLTFNMPFENEITLGWSEITDGLFEVQFKKLHDEVWITDYTGDNFFTLTDLERDEDYVLRIRTFCSQNIASEYSMEYVFTFLGEETMIGDLDIQAAMSVNNDINFTVFPNPAVNKIILNTEVSDKAIYRIVSPSGTELKTGAAKNANINVSDLATGLYIIEVQDFQGKKSTKFFKH